MAIPTQKSDLSKIASSHALVLFSQETVITSKHVVPMNVGLSPTGRRDKNKYPKSIILF